MELLATIKNSFIDPEVVSISQKIDILINQYQRLKYSAYLNDDMTHKQKRIV